MRTPATPNAESGLRLHPGRPALRHRSALAAILAALLIGLGVVPALRASADDSTPPDDPKWGNALMTVSPKVVQPGGVVTFTLIGESFNSRAGLLGGVGWGGTVAGPVVSGCTNFDMTCSFTVSSVRPRSWSWTLARASLPNNYFTRTEGCNTAPEYSCPSFVTTYGWSYWAIAPGAQPTPTASFTVERSPGTPAGTYRFTSTTQPVDGFTPSLSWNFGDGGSGSSSPRVERRFSQPGTYSVRLTACISTQCNTATSAVKVGSPGLSVGAFLVEQSSAVIPVVPPDANEPSRAIRIVVSATDGVGSVSAITLNTPIAALTPDGLVEIVSMPSPAPFDLQQGEQRTFDVVVIGRKTGVLNVVAGARGTAAGGTVSDEASTRIGVGNSGGLATTLSAKPSEVTFEEDENGDPKPRKVDFELIVKNDGELPLTNVVYPEKLDVVLQRPLTSPLDWDKIAVEIPSRTVLSLPKTLAPKQSIAVGFSWELRAATPLTFKASTLADNPDVPGQILVSLANTSVGPKKEKLARVEVKRPKGADSGPIKAGDIARYDLTFTNLSGDARMRIGPTTVGKVFGPVLTNGPELYSEDIKNPGIFTDDNVGPLEKRELRFWVLSADDMSKQLDNFKLRVLTSLEIEMPDGSWRGLEDKEVIAKPANLTVAGSVQNVKDPIADDLKADTVASRTDVVIRGLETVTGVVGQQVLDGLFFVYDAEQNPGRYAGAALDVTWTLAKKSYFYSQRLLPLMAANYWMLLTPGERAKKVQETYEAMEADSRQAFKLLGLGYDAIAKPFDETMTQIAVANETGNYTALQDGWLKLSANVALGEVGEGSAALLKLGQSGARRIFTQRALRGLVDDLGSPDFAAKVERAVGREPGSLGVSLPGETRCVAGKGDIAYGTTFETAEMETAAAIRQFEAEGMSQVATQENALITVRDRDADSVRLLNDRISTLKPEVIKAKGVSQTDIDFFGAPNDLKGQVAVFEPPSLDEVVADLRSKGIDLKSEKGLKVIERHGDRTKEFKQYLAEYRAYEKDGGFKIGFDGSENGRPDLNFVKERPFQLKDGGVTKGGKKVFVPQVRSESGKWFSFTGDIDGVSILNADGTLITDPAKMERIWRKLGLKIGDTSVFDVIGIPHGETASCVNGKLRDRYLWGVRDAWQFGPDGKIRFVRPVQALSGDGFVFMRGGYFGGNELFFPKIELSTLKANMNRLVLQLSELDLARATNNLEKLKDLKNVDAQYLSALEDIINNVKGSISGAPPKPRPTVPKRTPATIPKPKTPTKGSTLVKPKVPVSTLPPTTTIPQ